MTVVDRRAAGLTTQDDLNEQERERFLNRARKLRDAFVEVFGPPGKRTPHGTIILEELERFTNYSKLIREQDSTGQTDIYRTGIKEGRREVIQAIHNLIEWRETSEHTSSSSP